MIAASFFAHYDAIPLPLIVFDRNGGIVYRNEYAISRFSPYEEIDYIQSFESILLMEQNQLKSYLDQAFTVTLGEFISLPLPYTKERIRFSRVDENLATFIIVEDKEAVDKEIPQEKREKEKSIPPEDLQQQFHSLIDENPDGIAFVDEHLQLTLINQALHQMLGYSLDDLKHVPAKVVEYETILTIERHFELALHGDHHPYEIEASDVYGNRVHLLIKTIPIHTNGQFRGAYKIVKDITEFKSAQLDALDQAEQLRSLIDSIPEFIIFKDENGKIIEMNAYAKRIFGIEEGKYKGRTCEELNCSNIDAHRLLKNNANTDRLAWKQQAKVDYEYQLELASGEMATFEIIKAPTFHSNGKRKYLIAIGRDISERKEVERELIETQEFIESIFTNNADAISVSNLDKEIIQVNPAFKKLYGFNDEDMITYLHDIYPEHNKDEANRITKAVLNGEEVVDFETVRVKKDGTQIDVSVTYSPIKDHEGNVTAMSAITRDIRDRKKTEELLLRSEKLSAIGQLAAAVAHEVRNPLTSVKGFIQLYKDRINDEILELMLSEMDRIEGIINEFLSLARPQAVTYQQIDIMALTRNVVSLMNPELLLNKVNIRTVFHTPSLMMHCEKNQITQVLMNVIKNGIESMPDGGLLSITTCNSDTHLFIEIADKGVGIPKDRLERLGEPFFSNKDTGTGLGLVVCYKIIHEHHGTIHFDSTEGVGTVVTITLPLQR
ncbi:PAS domain-containing sensor histidine kinase [Bacillus sp. es.036]|uniref:PAS domain-containing sensor histidine kinase n=1 Tax=Bacillus sp. es.036 TaxID=1761764 RepID=UPI000BF7EE6A|nr:PAS domain-containing sensor histidine kinase [Bacillus sp. es.036]PFG12388.1 two-component system sporulation sensor kinase A [Bacillus sp. es.036]